MSWTAITSDDRTNVRRAPSSGKTSTQSPSADVPIAANLLIHSSASLTPGSRSCVLPFASAMTTFTDARLRPVRRRRPAARSARPPLARALRSAATSRDRDRPQRPSSNPRDTVVPCCLAWNCGCRPRRLRLRPSSAPGAARPSTRTRHRQPAGVTGQTASATCTRSASSALRASSHPMLPRAHHLLALQVSPSPRFPCERGHCSPNREVATGCNAPEQTP
jgi:hypothetical protein